MMTENQQKLLALLPERVKIEGCHDGDCVFVNDKPLDLKRSLKLRNHSPTGFNWGYGGSGPAQFALALLYRYAPKELALEFYQRLKFGWIAGLQRADFIMTVNLRDIMREIFEKEESHA
jgi:hypothetical protein